MFPCVSYIIVRLKICLFFFSYSLCVFLSVLDLCEHSGMVLQSVSVSVKLLVSTWISPSCCSSKFFLAMLVSETVLHATALFCLCSVPLLCQALQSSPVCFPNVFLQPQCPRGLPYCFFLSHLRGLHICTGWVTSWLLLRCITDAAMSAALQKGRRKHAGMYPSISKGFNVSGKQTGKNASFLEEGSQGRAGSTALLVL